MILLDPRNLTRPYPDERSREIMRATVEFFEGRGKARLKHDDRERVWYQEFLDFQARERIFATLLTPSPYGGDGCRWDTWRNCEFAEILGFYGLPYRYTWQVSVLGLGPIWMSGNEDAKRRAAAHLEQGAIFAFGLSKRSHGADVYSTDMVLTDRGDGTAVANGEKYYIGNGNAARMVSTFGRRAGSDEYVFFTADSQHPHFELIGNVVNSQNYVSHFGLSDYPVTADDILHAGDAAWNAALNTVNIGKYNLGWASIGICTHAFYEAVTHAATRRLYGMAVTDFPHVRRLFTDAYARLVAMKLVALRACDYMRSATLDDRRYLLYNPIVKMKVTTEGERVIDHLWDVIAAKGFARLPAVAVLMEQVEAFRAMLVEATPSDEQQQDVDFLLAVGQLFALIVYAGLAFENVDTYAIHDDLVAVIADVFVRDFSQYTTELHGRTATTPRQAELCLRMMRRPGTDPAVPGGIFAKQVLGLNGAYAMNP